MMTVQSYNRGRQQQNIRVKLSRKSVDLIVLAILPSAITVVDNSKCLLTFLQAEKLGGGSHHNF